MWKTELVNIAVNELSLLKMSLYCPNAGHRRVSQWYILVMTAILESSTLSEIARHTVNQFVD